ncbi:pyrimidine/purine nucleoside phosphorylase [Haloferula sargassicola]|uniref:Pyrimidine/purine nucleoside phosphorylase n=1 Tax=Haloferula sargassicola TaxID=490096 RepID=A0ABP9URH3_9BACT
MEFRNVTAHAKANVYFDGKVVSHAIVTASGEKKTLGVILPGSYHFGTDAPELMEIVGGKCTHLVDGTEEVIATEAGSSFNVPGKSGFTITVAGEPCHYVCSFL